MLFNTYVRINVKRQNERAAPWAWRSRSGLLDQRFGSQLAGLLRETTQSRSQEPMAQPTR